MAISRFLILTVRKSYFSPRQVVYSSIKHLTTMSARGNRMTWALSKESIDKKTTDLIQKTKKVYDSIGTLKPDEVTYQNVVKVLVDSDCEYAVERNNIDFVQHVFPDKSLRDASVAADKILSDFDVEMSMRQDVFDVLVAFEKKWLESQETLEPLTPESQRYVKRMIKIGRRNGLHLESPIQDRIKEIKKKMSDLSIDFSTNLNEENTVLEFTEEELGGLPEDFIKALDKTEAGKCKVTLKYPHYFPCMKKARNPETRQQLEKAFNSRCLTANTKILEELVQLRDEKAKLLGFPTHASFVLDMRMAKTSENVATFLKDLATKLEPLKRQDIETFLEFKKQEVKLGTHVERDFVEAPSQMLENWCWEKEPLNKMSGHYRDGSKIPEDLLDKLLQSRKANAGVFNMRQILLGTFDQTIHTRPQADTAAVLSQLSEELLGFPSTPETNMAASFGHLAGGYDAQYYGYMWSEVFCMDMFMSRFKEEGVMSKQTGMDYRQCILKPGGSLDADVMLRNFLGREPRQEPFLISKGLQADTAAVLSQLSEELLGFPSTPETNMAASFGHLAGGYDAQYYGYMWSEVFCMDMFMSRFKEEGVMSKQTGMDYRQCILKPGGSLDADVMLRNFLGREPRQEPFLISKGLQVE